MKGFLPTTTQPFQTPVDAFEKESATSSKYAGCRDARACGVEACAEDRQNTHLAVMGTVSHSSKWAEAGVSVFNGQRFTQGQARDEQATRGLSVDTNPCAPGFSKPHKCSPALPLPDTHFAEKCSTLSHLTWIWALPVGCFRSSGSYQNGLMRRSWRT